MLRRFLFSAVLLSLVSNPVAVFASVEITEVMYNPEASDSGREWVELQNTGDSSVNLDRWHFREDGTDHRISTTSQGDFTDSPRLPAGEYIILADDPAAVSNDYPNLSAVLNSSFTLVNSGESLSMINPDGVVSDSVNYDTSIGGDDNGNSLQKKNVGWIAAGPTPASANVSQSSSDMEVNTESESQNSESTDDDSGGTVKILEPKPEDSGDEYEDAESSEESDKPSQDTITVNAGSDIRTIAGVQIHLDGTVTSSKRSLLAGRDIRWSLGNGDTTEGADTFYTYNHPDQYTATLMAKGPTRTISDEIEVLVSPPKLSIASTSPGTSGFIQIANDLNHEVNLAGWHLRTAGGVATLPDYTIVPTQDTVTITNKGTGIARVAQAQLLYPDGRVADTYQPNQTSGGEDSNPQPTTTTDSVNESADVATDNPDSQAGAPTTSSQQSLNELFATSSQQANAGTAVAGNVFWRWALLLVILVVSALIALVGLNRWGLSSTEEDKLSETFNINEM
jgi:hypothetical protein